MRLLDDADRTGGTKPKMDPLPPKGARSIACSRRRSSRRRRRLPQAAPRLGRARATASALIRRAESLARVAPLAARHVSAVVALVHQVRSEIEDVDALDAETADSLASASSALRTAVLGDATPFGPALGDAALARASRDVRVGFARRVIATCPASSPSVLALAGGWLVAEMRADAARGVGGGDVASRAVFSAALATIRNAGWVSDARGGDESECGEFGDGGGWYRESADAARFGFATRERVALCLLAFHGASKEARAEALADAAAVAAGKDDPNASSPPRRPRGGALARAARAHAACVFAHCARHVDARAAPAWLETRARNVLRGDVAETFANARTALDAALDACLFEADETVTESPEPFVENEDDERAFTAALSSLPNELVASVRAAALALAEDAASDEKGEKSRGSFEVSARARRAAWDALRALPPPPETETRVVDADDASAAAFDASTPPVGSFAFAWRCASRFRLNAHTSTTSSEASAATRLDAVVAALDAGDAMASPSKMALTCAAAEALSRGFAAEATRGVARVPPWPSLAELAASARRGDAPVDRRGACGARVARGRARRRAAALGGDPSRRPPRPRWTPRARASRARLARCWATTARGRRAATPPRGRGGAEEAARAYLSGSDVASVLFACQTATVAALEATARAARADATLGARAAAAAAARIGIDAVVADPATEFAVTRRATRPGSLRDAGSAGSSPEVLAAMPRVERLRAGGAPPVSRVGDGRAARGRRARGGGCRPARRRRASRRARPRTTRGPGPVPGPGPTFVTPSRATPRNARRRFARRRRC